MNSVKTGLINNRIQNNNLLGENLIYKYPFQNPIFNESREILDWSFSKIILITAFDLLRNDSLTSFLQRSGSTLKEYIRDFGFNKDIKIMVDTGIFEVEAKKARLEFIHSLPPELDLNLNDIFTAYELIDPDYLIAPDEMILLEDDEKVVESKINTIVNNLDQTLDRFPRDKIIPTIQGVNQIQIEKIVDKISDEKFNIAARGGVLPLRRASHNKFRKILPLTEKIARSYGINHLHAFGLPGVSGLVNFFVDNSYNSVDTSMIYYKTAQRKYLKENGEFWSVRSIHFKDCWCEGCRIMTSSRRYPNGWRFSLGLYYHNAMQLKQITQSLINNPKYLDKSEQHYRHKNRFKVRGRYRSNYGNEENRLVSINDDMEFRIDSVFKPANQMNETKPSTNITDPLTYRGKYLSRIPKLFSNCQSNRKKILVIGSCSAWKAIKLLDQPNFSDLDSREKRDNIKIKYQDLLMPAKDMYRGLQHRAIIRAVYHLRKLFGNELVELNILSAGFGLIDEEELIPPYDSSFSLRDDKEIEVMASALNIRESILKIKSRYDLVYIALSDPYLEAIGDLRIFEGMGKEVVYFGSPNFKVGLSLKYPFINFATEEFYEISRGHNFRADLGQRYRLKGSIFENYALDLRDTFDKPHDISFVKYWYKIFEKSKSKYFYE